MDYVFQLFVFVSTLSFLNVVGAFQSSVMSAGSWPPEDASEVTWAHAVNSRDALNQALQSPVDFLEADISLGHVTGHEDVLPIPVMAHPPSKISDISLDDWLNTIVSGSSDKGLKLDFKSIEVVEPSLLILQKYSAKINSPVWLNADVLPGPVNSQSPPVLVHQFLAKCHQYFPKATLSIGWTTYWFQTVTTPEMCHYEWQHVRKMVDVIRCSGYESNYPKFTFPVRGIFASRSIKLLQWLLSAIPGSTLTVWSGKYDPLEMQDLIRIRSAFPKQKVYYDIPENLRKEFSEKKISIDIPGYDLVKDDDQWMTLTRGHGDSCPALTYVSNRTVVFGRALTTAVLKKNLLMLGKDSNLKITGHIKFFNSSGESPKSPVPPPPKGMHELMLVLADVSLFTKNMSDFSQNDLDLTTSDTEVIWSAINSSVIFTFQHHYLQAETSCRTFKLDITSDKSFEVWTVPCDTMLEESSFDEIAKSGVPEISSRKRLVLPEGPMMFGLVSKGEEHVVVHDLTIDGVKEALTSGSTTPSTKITGFFATLLFLSLWMFTVL